MNEFLEKHRVKEGFYGSLESDGFNGMFRFILDGQWIRTIASDGEGWQHVSVSREGASKPPNWDIMCQVKNLFFGEDVWVIQFHPSKAEYVNNHPGCLHLWRPTGEVFPTPKSNLVGLKNKTPEQFDKMSLSEKWQEAAKEQGY